MLFLVMPAIILGLRSPLKSINKIILFVFGISPLIVLYVTNPQSRVYSVHGFIHHGIFYNILNNGIPPTNPLLAGEKLFYYWGYHTFAVLIGKIANLSPSIVFATINVFSFALCIILIFKISKLLIEDDSASIFAVLISLFAITPISTNLVEFLTPLFSSFFKLSGVLENRATPAVLKFYEINGSPLGLSCFLLFLITTLKLLDRDSRARIYLLYCLSIICCGFLYPPMLPAIIITALIISLINVLMGNKETLYNNLKNSGIILLLLMICVIVVYPHMSGITEGVRAEIRLFAARIALKNIISAFILFFPILLLIFITKNKIKDLVDIKKLIFISTAVIVPLFMFFFINQPHKSEYKYLIIAATNLGILGGLSFYFLRLYINKIIIYFLVILFLSPAYFITKSFLVRYYDMPTIKEDAINLIYPEREEEELYQWIRENTSTQSIFIDNETTMPVFGQRSLLIGMDNQYDKWPEGYGMPISMLLEINGYSSELCTERENIVENIYNPNTKEINSSIKKALQNSKSTYIIIRNKEDLPRFKGKMYVVRFKSSKGNYIVLEVDI